MLQAVALFLLVLGCATTEQHDCYSAPCMSLWRCSPCATLLPQTPSVPWWRLQMLRARAACGRKHVSGAPVLSRSFAVVAHAQPQSGADAASLICRGGAALQATARTPGSTQQAGSAPQVRPTCFRSSLPSISALCCAERCTATAPCPAVSSLGAAGGRSTCMSLPRWPARAAQGRQASGCARQAPLWVSLKSQRPPATPPRRSAGAADARGLHTNVAHDGGGGGAGTGRTGGGGMGVGWAPLRSDAASDKKWLSRREAVKTARGPRRPGAPGRGL